MSRGAPGRVLTAVVAGAAVLMAGCSSTSGAGEVVTVTQRVTGDGGGGATPARPTATVPPEATVPTAPSVDPGTAEAPESPDEPATTAETSEESAGSEEQAPTTRSSRSASDDDPRPSADHPTENAPDADRDTPGAETGTKCATNAEYVDEDPAGLRSDVVTGWRTIEKEANADGVIVCLNDGKRSTAQQQAQYDEYAEQYGEEVADQLVLPPEKSAHVIGNAIDIQPQAAYQWLQATKGSLGFCRIYDNEPWHFEYDVAYFTDGCPARLPKPEG